MCDQAARSIQLPSGLALSLDPASNFLKSPELYVRKARRYLMRQAEVKNWTEAHLTRILALKATNEVRDHLRKIRSGLAAPSRSGKSTRESDETHKDWIKTIIASLEAQTSKSARDGAVLVRYVWQNTSALTETPRGISFKAQAIATELTRTENEVWDGNRVQRARMFVIDQFAHIEGESVADVIHIIRSKIA